VIPPHYSTEAEDFMAWDGRHSLDLTYKVLKNGKKKPTYKMNFKI
jgi:hypothetical protein